MSPCSALSTGPRMESVPAQYSKIAVDNPCARLEPPEILETARAKAVSSESFVPISPPSARLTIKSTRYLLAGIACTMALIPSAVAASPMASIITVLYRSPIPFLSVPPTAHPINIAPAFVMVPIMFGSSFGFTV